MFVTETVDRIKNNRRLCWGNERAMTRDQISAPGRGNKGGRSFPPTGRSLLSRRRFLGLIGMLSGTGVVIYASFATGVKRLIYILRPRLDHTAPTGRLSAQEMDTMVALLEILLPGTLWPGREPMADMVNQATENVKGVLQAYQAGLCLLDQTTREYTAGRGFAVAKTEMRQRILETLLWKYAGGKSGTLSYYIGLCYASLERLCQSAPRRQFRELVVRDLLRRFYAGSVAWKMAGYSRYPGIPGYPRASVRPLQLER
jgi:hypothetical protein